jgi:endogenous inhibitor of DNA gyrase (YacG/DUF329 family)
MTPLILLSLAPLQPALPSFAVAAHWYPPVTYRFHLERLQPKPFTASPYMLRPMRGAISRSMPDGSLPVRVEADCVLLLLKATRTGRDPSGIEVLSDHRREEGPEGARLVQKLFDVLQRMGRSVTDCPICLSPLDPADESQRIDVLKYMHTYHHNCLHAHIRRRLNDRGGSACPTCRAPIMLTNISEFREPGDW